jgi:hypothetical protein
LAIADDFPAFVFLQLSVSTSYLMQWDVVGSLDMVLAPLFVRADIEEQNAMAGMGFLFDLGRTIRRHGSGDQEPS